MHALLTTLWPTARLLVYLYSSWEGKESALQGVRQWSATCIKIFLRVRVCFMILLVVQMARVHALDKPTVHLLRTGTMLWADDSST